MCVRNPPAYAEPRGRSKTPGPRAGRVRSPWFASGKPAARRSAQGATTRSKAGRFSTRPQASRSGLGAKVGRLTTHMTRVAGTACPVCPIVSTCLYWENSQTVAALGRTTTAIFPKTPQN
jgi:hypothetical protein